MRDELIVIGRLGAPHGLGGELRLFPETDFPERLVRGRRVAACPEHGEPYWTEIAGVRPLGVRGLAVAIRGLASRDAAAPYAGGTLRVAASDLPALPEGRYYHHQIIGLEVVRADGRVLGRISEVRQTGANDVYVVTRAEGGSVLVPAIRDAVAAIDVHGGRLRLRHLPGLLDDA